MGVNKGRVNIPLREGRGCIGMLRVRGEKEFSETKNNGNKALKRGKKAKRERAVNNFGGDYRGGD